MRASLISMLIVIGIVASACAPALTPPPTNTITPIPPTATSTVNPSPHPTEKPEPVYIPSLEPTATAIASVFAAYYNATRAFDIEAVMALIADSPEKICFRECYSDRAAIRRLWEREFQMGHITDVQILSVEGNVVRYRWRLYDKEGNIIDSGTAIFVVENGKVKSDYNE